MKIEASLGKVSLSTNIYCDKLERISILMFCFYCLRGQLKMLYRAIFGPLFAHPWPRKHSCVVMSSVGQVFATFATFFTALDSFRNTQNVYSTMFQAVSRNFI